LSLPLASTWRTGWPGWPRVAARSGPVIGSNRCATALSLWSWSSAKSHGLGLAVLAGLTRRTSACRGRSRRQPASKSWPRCTAGSGISEFPKASMQFPCVTPGHRQRVAVEPDWG
jgi:hypothetical protein